MEVVAAPVVGAHLHQPVVLGVFGLGQVGEGHVGLQRGQAGLDRLDDVGRVSDLGGRAGMVMKAAELGVELDDRAAAALTDELKELEAQGWVFEAADASLELRMRRATGWRHDFFRTEAYRVSSYHRASPEAPDLDADTSTEATVKIWVGDERIAAVGEGNGPINALDHALRRALNGRYPALERIHLVDFKVRVVDGGAATGAVVRVLIESTDGNDTWFTTGVDANVIEASWMALTDSIVWGLEHMS
ncbi:MAG: hypothetical protein KDB36_18010 [Acidimicrobiales bacterium]|nr:hypothetical protein [Acidimicrobiales bacterium]